MNTLFEVCSTCLLKVCCTTICDEFMQEREKYFCELTELLDKYVYIKTNLRSRILNACPGPKRRNFFAKKMSERKGAMCSTPPNHIKIRIRVLTDNLSYSNLRIRQTYENDNEWKEVIGSGI
jgi:hypothetical protein